MIPTTSSPAVRAFPEACYLPLDVIDPNPDQPRRELAGIAELAAHSKYHGLLQPIVVTPSATAEGRYTLVAGHRRLAALQWLATSDTYPDRWRDIPAVIRHVETAERLALALAENVSRHALTDAELVTAVRLLVDLHGWSQSEIARRLGVTRQWIGQFAHVIADPELATLVQTGALSAAKAYEVLRAPPPWRARPPSPPPCRAPPCAPFATTPAACLAPHPTRLPPRPRQINLRLPLYQTSLRPLPRRPRHSRLVPPPYHRRSAALPSRPVRQILAQMARVLTR